MMLDIHVILEKICLKLNVSRVYRTYSLQIGFSYQELIQDFPLSFLVHCVCTSHNCAHKCHNVVPIVNHLNMLKYFLTTLAWFQIIKWVNHEPRQVFLYM